MCLNQISRSHTFDQHNSTKNLKSSGQFFHYSWLTKRDPVRSRVKFYVRTKLFQQVVFQLGAKQIKSSAYHPESQGALERVNSTLKNIIRTHCLDNEGDWDEGISLLLFAVRQSVQETLGFSPFELVFGHSVRGPPKLLNKNWLSENIESLNLLDYVSKFRDKLKRACELAQQNLKNSQSKMKMLYDRKVQNHIFNTGGQGFSVITWPNEQTSGQRSRVIPSDKESRNSPLHFLRL